MTFTLHTELSPSDPALEQLLDGCADVRVEFEADVTPEWDAGVRGACEGTRSGLSG